MSVKLKWKVAPAPTGRFRSFERRGWPSASFGDGSPAVQLYCDESYTPRRAKEKTHPPIKVCVALYNSDPQWTAFKWRTLVDRFASVEEARVAAQSFWDKHHKKFGPNPQP